MAERRILCYEGSVEHILKLHDEEIRGQEVSFELQEEGARLPGAYEVQQGYTGMGNEL